jgi:uncharacterized protein YgiM (DUF1202 family)
MVNNMASSKGTDKSERLNNILTFIKQNIRYFAAGALFLVLVLVLVNCGTKKDGIQVNMVNPATETTAEAETQEAFQVDTYEDVNALINQYFTAYAAGDVDTIAAIATPITDNEKSYIAEYSKYVDSYENIQCYTKHGLDDKSYMVSARIDIKFTGADTPAPGLDFFYVRTQDDGSLIIDNLYSQYNRRIRENAVDTSVQSLIEEYENSDDLIALQQEVQSKYDEALASDADLADILNIKLPAAIVQWKQNILAQAAAESTETTEQPEETETAETTEQPEETQQPESEQQEAESTSEQVYTTDKVNVRREADTSSEKLGSLEKGTAISRTGTEGEWSVVNYGGVTGYIKTEFLTTEQPQADTTTDTSSNQSETATGSLAEGTVITLTESTNIRSDMSETASKVGTAFSGEKVTVVMSYAEGWTKVTWNGKTGYIKTSLLQ